MSGGIDKAAVERFSPDGFNSDGRYFTFMVSRDGGQWVRASDYDALSAHAKKLERQNEALREALSPFAEYMHTPEGRMDLDNLGAEVADNLGVGWIYLTHGDFRRARAALTAHAENERLRGLERDTYATQKKVAGDLQARSEKTEAERDAWEATADALAQCLNAAQYHSFDWKTGFDALAAHAKLKGDV